MTLAKGTQAEAKVTTVLDRLIRQSVAVDCRALGTRFLMVPSACLLGLASLWCFRHSLPYGAFGFLLGTRRAMCWDLVRSNRTKGID